MTNDDRRSERVTWLRVELADVIERCERGEIDVRQLAARSGELTNQEEVDHLGDALLQHTYWAMQHAYQRPACWAPSAKEMIYLRRCLQDEELFDPDQIDTNVHP